MTVKSVDEDKRIIRGIATTPNMDREGDIVEPLGVRFANPMPLLHQHDSRRPVGTVLFDRPTKDGIAFEARIPQVEEPPSLKDRVDTAWSEIKLGLVRGVSIGFMPRKRERLESGGAHFLEIDVFELSLVTIPAHQDAGITFIKQIALAQIASSESEQEPQEKSFDREQRGNTARNAGPVRLIPPPGSSGASFTKSHQLPPGRSGVPIQREGTDMTTKTIAEQITALEATRAGKAARMSEVMQKSIDEGRSTDAAEREEFDTLEQEVDALDGDLKRLRSLEKAAAVAAKPVGEVKNAIDAATARAGITVPAQPIKMKPQREKGIDFARYAMCVAAGRGNLMQSLEIAKSRYGDDDDVVSIMKAAVNAGTTTDTSWAGALVEAYPRFTGDFVSFLRPMTVLGKFGTDGIPALRRVPFNVSIAGQTSGGTGYWVGQGAPKPLTRFDFTTFNIPFSKVAAISVLTEELIRFSNPSAETVVRDQLAAALIERLDIDLLDPNKAEVANVSPASITNGVTPIASTGNDADAIREDVRLMMQAYINANITPSTGVWIMSASVALSLSLMRNSLGQREFPDITMMGGRFEGLPVIVSEYATSDSNGHDIVLVNASDIWLADDDQVTVDASREASLQMLDDPTNNSGTATPTTMVSMFQTNSVAIRCERMIAWKKRRTQAVQLLGNANWGEPGSS